jgi:hypothetical protein
MSGMEAGSIKNGEKSEANSFSWLVINVAKPYSLFYWWQRSTEWYTSRINKALN